ncbi:MAG: glycosyltransferase family 4 protein [Pseudomonas sp.]
MRLLVVSQYFWPENFRVNDLVAELVARGHEVTVLTGEPNYPEGRIFDAYRRNPAGFASHAGAQVERVPLLPRGKGSVRLALNYLSFVLSGALLGPWRLRGRQFDAIFVFQTSPITAALPALLLRWVKRAPLAMWVLDLWPETLSAVGVVRSPRVLGWVGGLVSFIYRRCDRILAQSRAFFANIGRWSGDVSRIRYFPGWAEGIFEGELQCVDPAPEVEPYHDTFNVMFAGNLGEAQDFPAILDAAERLRDRLDVRWLIVGDGRAAEFVRAEIARRALGDRVVLLGRHAIERMPSFFRAASALLVSLKADPVFAMTIPGKVQSYLAAGLPLLGMLDGEGARVIEESGAGLVCAAGDGHALAQRVEQLAALSAAERSTMGERGRAYCQREFDREVLITRLEQWLAELAATRVGS